MAPPISAINNSKSAGACQDCPALFSAIRDAIFAPSSLCFVKIASLVAAIGFAVGETGSGVRLRRASTGGGAVEAMIVVSSGVSRRANAMTGGALSSTSYSGSSVDRRGINPNGASLNPKNTSVGKVSASVRAMQDSGENP